MTGAAFKACYSDWKLIKTRGVVQVVMEVPLAEADAAYKVLGGMPDFGSENWFAIAALKTEKENPKPIPISAATPRPVTPDKPLVEAKRTWNDMSPQQLCDLP
jgi:hypothetical protein